MSIKYYKLFDLLNRRGMKKTDLLEVVSAPTLAKLSKGKTVTTEVISNICNFLNCQPGDLMEYVSDTQKQEEPKDQPHTIQLIRTEEPERKPTTFQLVRPEKQK